MQMDQANCQREPTLKLEPREIASQFQSGVPPALPPRPSTTAAFTWPLNGSYGNSQFNNYYGAPGFMGSWNQGYNPYRPYAGSYFNPSENSVLRSVENTSHQALHSVESFVQTISAISTMLESSLAAVYSSIRAVLGVAENFVHLKANLQRVFTTITVLKAIRWLWNKVLVILRIRQRDITLTENVWESVSTSAVKVPLSSAGDSSTFKLSSLIFYALAVGGPLLIWKIVSKLIASSTESQKWATGLGEHYTAVALYDFQAGPNELPLNAGAEIRVAPKELQPAVKGWLLASNGTAVGLVPGNYIRIVRKVQPLPEHLDSLMVPS